MSHAALIDLRGIQELPALRPAQTDKVHQLARNEVASTPLPTPATTIESPVLLQEEAVRHTRKQSTWVDAKMLACFCSMLVSGWSDASAGSVSLVATAISISSLRREGHYCPPSKHGAWYGVSYSVVSLIWISQAAGFFVASIMLVHLTHFLGEGKVYALGCLAQVIGFAFIVPALPFEVVCLSYAVIGWGESILVSRTNTYVADMPSAAFKLGLLQSFYGVGAVLTPITATAMVDNGIRWSYAYAITLGLALINTSLVVYAFRLQREPAPARATPDDINLDENISLLPEEASSTLRRVLRNKVTVWYSIFLCLYVGAEVSEGGWLASYLIDERHAGTRAGYVTSGFWGGVTLGRLIFPSITVRFGEWRTIAVLICLAEFFLVLVWVIPDFVGSAVCFSITGFLISCHYPTAISLSTKLLPRSLHNGAIGFMASTGQIGAALFPFFCGLLAQRYSTTVLQPYLIVLLALMLATWLGAPRPRRSGV